MLLRAYAQLIRLPNLPSALSNICLGAIILHVQPRPNGESFPWLSFVLLLCSSACLYCAGMVWNDWFDLEQDKRERPQRPLPSGRISLAAAARLGSGLMLAGVVLAALAGGPAVYLALCLVAAIFLYDGWLKQTAMGPAGMGLCRFLNVLLGVSLAGTLAFPWALHLAGVVGLYVAGVTWFARTEARESSRSALRGATLVMGASLLLALPLPLRAEQPAASPAFPYLLVVLGFLIGMPAWKAIRNPVPERVQSAVKRSLICLIVLDAVLATALAGTWGLLLLLLLIPGLVLNWQKWLYAT